MEQGAVGGILIIAFFILLPIILFITGRMTKKKLNKIIQDMEVELGMYKSELNTLTDKYSGIVDIELHIEKEEKRFKQAVETQRAEVNAEVNAEINAAKELTTKANLKMTTANEKALTTVENARVEAERVITSAKNQAQEIAGDAYEAKEKADTYAKAIKAMKNTIEGYQNDYIIPNHSVLDDLADEFSHKDAGAELKKSRALIKSLVKQSMAGTCDYVEKQRKLYAEHFVVDAFNGKVDSALAKVKVDNYGKIKQEIIDAFALVNHNGKSFRNARINQDFLDARLDELKWAVATYELRQIELEEQREIKQQIREEEKAQREMDKAIKAAQKEEELIQKTLEKVRTELAAANDDQRLEFEAKLAELEGKLADASERGVRAMSMAQQTRRGHVYVISNIGSFGEEVFKIGMTRRLEPMDRVKELGDASVAY
ncbi:DUF4041 domain-containing protein [Moritella yayanosii]|uniref:Uncharacterized protein n=1 Tax=Moritella yayanosii TaxID=69539 RepID=A0A330LUJ5_9GAMM|nr:DUF4041 domain-containing protein [Moritella yayanosii]SQD80413.1 conserved protein of unknown function, existed only in PE36 of Moritella, and KT99, DB21MT-2 of Shewanella [Moritella yayanosii]